MILGESTHTTLHPCLIVVLSEIIIEGHRFDIFEDVGCLPNYYNVTLAYPITFLWNPVLLLITLVYGGALGPSDLSPRLMAHHTLVLNIRIFWRSSQMFHGMLGSNKNPNQNRYIRLIALSSCQILTSLPFALFGLYVNAHVLTVYPWISWDDTHSHYYFVGQVPSFMWRASPISEVMVELSRWIPVVSAFLFFAFFGFAEEAVKHYRKAYTFASSSLHLPNRLKSRATSSPPYTPSSSFGQSFKKGMAMFSSFKGGFSALGSSSLTKSETSTAERKGSFLVSEHRLTSSVSIFEGVGNSPKALEMLPGDDDSQLAPASVPAPVSRSAIEALAAVSHFPAPPPIARVSVRSLPPGLYPQSPTASDLYLDPSEKV